MITDTKGGLGSGEVTCVLGERVELLRLGARQLFAGEPGINVIAEATTGSEVLRLVEACAPDVAILDVQLPGRDGISVCQEISRRHTKTKVVLLTDVSDSHTVQASLAAGASGYVLKHSAPNDLLRAVRAATAGRTFVDSELTDALVRHGRTEPRLSMREQEVINLLSHGLTTAAIGEKLFLSPATIRTYVESSMRKLGARNRVHAVAIGLRDGLLK
jgi:DNA-binding NarL/FixJ family response regulator